MDISLPTVFCFSFPTAISRAVLPGLPFPVAATENLHCGRTTGLTAATMNANSRLGLFHLFDGRSGTGPVILLRFGVSMLHGLPKLGIVAEQEFSSGT